IGCAPNQAEGALATLAKPVARPPVSAIARSCSHCGTPGGAVIVGGVVAGVSVIAPGGGAAPGGRGTGGAAGGVFSRAGCLGTVQYSDRGLRSPCQPPGNCMVTPNSCLAFTSERLKRSFSAWLGRWL